MSEENPEGTENEITPEQIESAKELLTKQGLNVLDQDSFSKRLAKERSKPERDLEALRAEFEALKEQNSELAAFRKEIENKDKSELEILEQRQAEWQKADQKKQADLEQAMADLEAERKKNNDFQVKMKLRSMLTDPIDEDVALMWAMNNVKGLTVNDSGDLVFTEPTGVVHEGPAAEKVVSDWWGKQTSLQRPKASGPETSGSPKAPPPQKETYRAPDPSLDISERLRIAEAEQKRLRGR